MRYFRLFTVLGIVLGVGSAAWAQYGLYGSPEMLPLVESQPRATVPSYAWSAAQPGPAYSPAPVQTGAPRTMWPASGSAGYPLPGVASASPSRLLYASGGEPKRAGPREGSPSEQPLRLDPPQPQGRSVVDRMLEEAGNYPATSGCGVYDGCAPVVCPPDEYGCGPYPTCGNLPWYARGSWLIMGRDEPNRLWTSFETNNNANQLTNTQDISLRWGNGGEIRAGRYFCCGTWAVEMAYWGLDQLSGQISTTHPNTVSTPLSFMDVVYADPLIPGNPVDLFDGADEHRLFRSDEVHNVELNVIRNPLDIAGRGTVDIDWLVGVRYFRFEEQLNFHSLRGGGSWATPADVGQLEDRIVNNLVGVQFGFDVDYEFYDNFRFFLIPKIGIYNNQIEHRFRAQRGDGELFAPDPASGVPGSYPVSSTQNALSFLTEIDLGLDWQITPRWSAFAGYRVVIATGMGLADHQIPPFVVDIPEIADIDHNGDLILHGAFAGVSYTF